MQSIKSILPGVIKRTGISGKMKECEALLMWDKVASSLVSRTKAVGISRGRMSINVTDSVVLYQLTLFKKEYIDKINKMLGKRLVRDIIFRVGRVEREKLSAENRDEYIKRLHSVELDQNEMTQIDEITAQIEDEEIRSSLKELFISQSQLSKIRK